jgi:hypothetical protein
VCRAEEGETPTLANERSDHIYYSGLRNILSYLYEYSILSGQPAQEAALLLTTSIHFSPVECIAGGATTYFISMQAR